MSPSSSRSGPPLPHEALLVPLLDTAADVLRELEPGDIPAALRPLAGFDRRGLARSAARSQLARALETEKAFRGKVVEQFVQRPEVQAALDAWSPSAASKLVTDAAGRDDLPLLVSALFADRPAGWEFGLGVASEAYERRRREDDAEDDRRAVETRVANAERARKRAEEARGAMEQQLTRLEAELKEERRLRRAREEDTGGEQDAIRRNFDQLETALAQSRASMEAEQQKRRAAEDTAEQAERGMRDAIAQMRVAEDQLRESQTAAQRAAGLVRAAEARIDELERMVERLQDEARATAASTLATGPAPSEAATAASSTTPSIGTSELRVLDQVSRVAAELARQLDKLTQRVSQQLERASHDAPLTTASHDAPLTTAAVDAPPVAPIVIPEVDALVDEVVVEIAVEPTLGDDAMGERAGEGDDDDHDVVVDVAQETDVDMSFEQVSPDEPFEALTLDDAEALDAIPVQVPTVTRRGRRRAPVPVPPRLLDDSAEAAEAMVRTAGLAIVVDGYNVSMHAWPDLSLVQQRDRLCSALNELQLRLRCQVTVVFDGADVDGGRPLRYPGLRVIFSKPGEEADDVVIRQVAARPLTVPVLVVSSDGWVRDHAEAEGARVIPSATLLKVLRR